MGRLVHEPKPVIPAYKHEHYRVVLTFLKPFDVYGLASLSTVYYDSTRLPDTDLYIPALRRTRRVPSTQRFEPVSPYSTLFTSDLGLHNDPLLTWSWTLVGRKPMLAPSPSNKGYFAPPDKRDPFTFVESNDKFPRSTWELRPEILVVDGVPPADSPYGKKRMYIDAIYHRAQTVDIGIEQDGSGNSWCSSFVTPAFRTIWAQRPENFQESCLPICRRTTTATISRSHALAISSSKSTPGLE